MQCKTKKKWYISKGLYRKFPWATNKQAFPNIKTARRYIGWAGTGSHYQHCLKQSKSKVINSRNLLHESHKIKGWFCNVHDVLLSKMLGFWKFIGSVNSVVVIFFKYIALPKLRHISFIQRPWNWIAVLPWGIYFARGGCKPTFSSGNNSKMVGHPASKFCKLRLVVNEDFVNTYSNFKPSLKLARDDWKIRSILKMIDWQLYIPVMTKI